MATAYEDAIHNMKVQIRAQAAGNLPRDGFKFSLFEAARYLSVAFMKDHIEVLTDLTTES